MKASDLFVKCLEEEGVERIFGVPGEENADMMISLLDSPIEFVLCRHEQSAAFMADTYGRLTGKAGVCLATLGPGRRNWSQVWPTPTWNAHPSLPLSAKARPNACIRKAIRTWTPSP